MVVLFSCLPFLKHTFRLPPLPFLLSFLPPGDAATGLKAAYDPRIKTEEEDGPECRPFTSKNLTIPTLFEACCESLPCWHLRGPHFLYCSRVRHWNLHNAAQTCYTQDSWEKPVNYLSPWNHTYRLSFNWADFTGGSFCPSRVKFDKPLFGYTLSLAFSPSYHMISSESKSTN